MNLFLLLFLPLLLVAVRSVGHEQLRRSSHHDENV
jgi:hypothetical protein